MSIVGNAPQDAPVSTAGLGPRAWMSALLLGGLAVACVLPFMVSGYVVFQFTLVIIYAIALVGLNILTGFNGQISLGHGAFYAIGAYTTAILLDRTGVPYWATVPMAGAVCLVAGFLFGIPALRLEGLYLALATFALAIAVPQMLKFHGLEAWTGGVQGIFVPKPDPPSFLRLNADQWLYFFSLAVAVLMFAIACNLLRGRIGRAIKAIRDHPIAAASMGIDIARYKAITFGVSAMYTGIAGALGALAAQFVSPDSFSFFLSISLLVGMVVGGIASIAGAVFGAIFIVYIPNLADQMTKAAPWAIYGLLLLGCMYAMPKGVAGLLQPIWVRMKRRV
ncbi:MAG: branched-chain amino acid ABC transporter permease [Xanthobacteraceae bacterium]